ncbi:hypothetical protein SISNIDRAFT_483769 [Sistotremastrum niveocremeum HHB9708]|uniref:MYND-type domain-containing protein n=1 Tax=Sistotremastrum niveocremeum HHB9708 TaxID=1314777 RepID=A0A164X0R6_9AGAM|nr:hypothetical protein SISNIDRAFT_483769 [Sistotremastrum niveocremeum HHB9708]
MLNCKICKTPTKKTCHGCSITPYCSTGCQKKDWIVHIVRCHRPGREITSADRLAAMVLSGEMATQHATMSDYGFLNLSCREDMATLLHIYREVFTILDLKPKTLHRWRLEDTLYTNLLKAYDDAGAKANPAHHAWLRQHPDLFDPATAQSPAQMWRHDVMDKLVTHVVEMAKSPSELVMLLAMASWPPHTKLCWDFYRIIFSGTKPTVHRPEPWIKFGFCLDLEDKIDTDAVPWEGPIQQLYAELVQRCTFDEFCTAFNTSCLVDLMDKHGLKERRLALPKATEFQQILSQSPYHIPAVWGLKSLMTHPSEIKSSHVLPFGFGNCCAGKDAVQLVRFYATLFKKPDISIFQIQHAAEQDRLYQFAMGLPGFAPSASERRFLRRVLRTQNKARYGSKLPPCYS